MPTDPQHFKRKLDNDFKTTTTATIIMITPLTPLALKTQISHSVPIELKLDLTIYHHLKRSARRSDYSQTSRIPVVPIE